MSLIDNLSNEKLFTKSEIEVINFIKENPNLVLNMTIGELANQTFSSNTTIIRICKKLGFNGFRDFKIEYLRNIESLKYLNNETDFTLPFQENEPTWQIINSISNVYKDSINLINSELNIAELEDIVEVLDTSPRTFVFGIGDSKITAMNFINKLVKIGKFFILTTENNEQESFCKGITTDDCCLFITYDKNESYKACLKILFQKRCKIIVITSNCDNPLVKYSNYHIIIPHKEKDEKIVELNASVEKIHTFYSQLAFNYILSIIYSLIYKRNKH